MLLEQHYQTAHMINKIEENKTYTDSKEKLKVQDTSILFLKHCIDIHPNKN